MSGYPQLRATPARATAAWREEVDSELRLQLAVEPVDAELDTEEAIIDERGREIAAISRDAQDVKTLFQEVAGLVEEQGEMLGAWSLVPWRRVCRTLLSKTRWFVCRCVAEHIDSNIDEAHASTVSGVNYLIRADARQRGAEAHLIETPAQRRKREAKALTRQCARRSASRSSLQ